MTDADLKAKPFFSALPISSSDSAKLAIDSLNHRRRLWGRDEFFYEHLAALRAELALRAPNEKFSVAHSDAGHLVLVLDAGDLKAAAELMLHVCRRAELLYLSLNYSSDVTADGKSLVVCCG